MYNFEKNKLNDKMKKLLLICSIFLLGNQIAKAQLSAGDIAFIGINEDIYGGTQDHSFTWIALTDIPAGEEIYFTDQGVNLNLNDWFANGEAHYKWTAPAGGLSCGTVVHNYENGATDIVVPSSGTMSGMLSGTIGWNISAGDQVLAYQAASVRSAMASTTFIAGIHKEGDAPGEANSWTFLGYNGTGTAYCHLPPGLTNGVNCVSVFDFGVEYDNGKYTGTLTGTSTALLASINNASNWTWDLTNSVSQDISPTAFSPSVTCTAPCTDPTIPTVTYSPATVCAGNNATLNISGTLNDATAWHVYTGSCGGTQIGTTAGSTFVVTPGSPSTTYYVRGEGGCVTPGSCGAVTVNVTNLDNAGFNYSAAAYCTIDTDPTPTITGLGGGAFSAGAGLSINAGNGAIDVSASVPGTYTVTYTTTGTCPNSSNVSVTINAADDASFSYSAAAYCTIDTDPTPTITGLAGGSFSSGAGLSISAGSGAIDVSTSTPGTYTVTYTTTGTCPNSSNVAVTINALDDASFGYSASAYCSNDSDPTPTITGLAGGSFSSGAGLSISAGSGAIDVSTSTPGTYTVTYTTTGTCPNSSNVAVTINALDDASFGYSAAAYCSNDSDPTPTITGLAGGSFSSGAGLSISAGSGAIDVSTSTPGTYTVTYTTTGTCPNSSNVSVTINAIADQTVAAAQSTFCDNGGSTTIDLGSSEIGVSYYLRDDANNAVIGGPIAGTGNSISLNTGSITTTTTYNVNAAISGGALNFDGIDDYVNTNIDISPSAYSEFTFEAWVYPTRVNHATRQSVFSHDDCCYDRGIIILNGTATWTVFIGGNYWEVANVDVNQWQHIAVVYDEVAKTAKFYKNGVEYIYGSPTNFSNSTNPMWLGRNPGFNEPFEGSIDEVRVWSSARNQTEIVSTKDDCLIGNEAGLEIYYKLDDATGSNIAIDETAGGNNGVLGSMDPASDWVTGIQSCGSCSMEMATLATVTVLPTKTGVHNETVCDGGSIVVNGTTYNASNLTGTEVFSNVGPNNCDSTVAVTLTILPALTGVHNETVCDGGSIVVNGTTYNASNLTGTEVFSNVGPNNCDSTVAVTLTILPALTGVHNETVCDGGSIVVNGTTYNASNLTGTEVFSNVGPNNCDSTVAVTLTILPALTGVHNETVCDGGSIVVNGTTYNASNLTGTEVFSNVGPNNCDSTVAVTLTILPALTGVHNETVCDGGSIVVNGTTYNASNLTGTEVFSNVGPNNCDSTVAVTLTILPALTGVHNETVCDGGSIVVNGTTYNASNLTGTEVFSNVGPNNCDSTVAVTLTILPAIDVTVTNASPVLTANQTGATYQWVDCDNGNAFIPSETNQSFTATATGNYAVEITVGNCVDTSGCENVIISSVNNINSIAGLSVYPNPTKGMVTVNLEKVSDNTSITVYDMLGKVIVTEALISRTTNIDLTGNEKGIYFINIQSDKGNVVRKVILQ